VVSAAMLNSLDNEDSVGEIMSNDFVTILLTYLHLNYFYDFK